MKDRRPTGLIDRHRVQNKEEQLSFRFRTQCALLALFFILVVELPVPVQAHNEDRPLALRDVTLDQKLGEQVPLGLQFHDEAGRTVNLSDYFGKRPVILTLVYLKCQDLCPLVLDGLMRTLRALSFTVGNQFDEKLPVPANAKEVIFKLPLKAGTPLSMQSYCYDSAGKELCGAYFAYVTRK